MLGLFAMFVPAWLLNGFSTVTRCDNFGNVDTTLYFYGNPW